MSSLQLNPSGPGMQTSNNNGIFSNPAIKYINHHLLEKLLLTNLPQKKV